jgi:hypothetical protein
LRFSQGVSPEVTGVVHRMMRSSGAGRKTMPSTRTECVVTFARDI